MPHTKKKRANNRILLAILFLLIILSTGFVILRKKTGVFDRFLGAEHVKVSVIIPVYNTEKYLDECLDSVQNQTLSGLEIICVNDGSKDGSPKILENHAKYDKRIKIVNQENGGVSSARNNGLKNATGDYVMFLDSDDSFVSYACEKAYNVAVKNESDVVEFGVKNFVDGENVDLSNVSYDDSKITVYTRKENENPFSSLNFSCGVVWNKIWKRSFITENDLKFKEGIYRGEDSLFNMMAGPHLYKFVKDDNILHIYRTGRPGSAMTVTQTNIKKKLDSFLVIAKELVDNKNKFSFDGADEWMLSSMLWMIQPAIVDELDKYEDKNYYSQKALEIINDEFVKKYNITPPEDLNNMINDLQVFVSE